MRRKKPAPITRLDYAFATVKRLRAFKAVPWIKIQILLALAKRPMRAIEMERLVNDGADLGSPLTRAHQDGLIARSNSVYQLTAAGEEMVREILNPPVPDWNCQ